jgi:hypothetical protein
MKQRGSPPIAVVMASIRAPPLRAEKPASSFSIIALNDVRPGLEPVAELVLAAQIELVERHHDGADVAFGEIEPAATLDLGALHVGDRGERRIVHAGLARHRTDRFCHASTMAMRFAALPASSSAAVHSSTRRRSRAPSLCGEKWFMRNAPLFPWLDSDTLEFSEVDGG